MQILVKKSITKLRSVTCHVGSRSVSCRPARHW